MDRRSKSGRFIARSGCGSFLGNPPSPLKYGGAIPPGKDRHT